MSARRLPKLSDADMRRIELYRIYRAHVEPRSLRDPELTVFVEASTRAEAHDKVRGVCRALGNAPATPDGDWPYYNLNSGYELMEQGSSSEPELRLLETGWGGPDADSNGVSCWVRQPIFAVPNPLPLLQAWARLPQRAGE